MIHLNKKLKVKKHLIFFLFLTMPVLAFSQESNLGNWLIYLGDKQLNKEWNWHHEVQHRNYNAIGDLEQLLLRTGIGYNLSENNNNLLIGYAYIHSQNYISESDDKVKLNEHRIYQQFITRQNFGRVFLQHRYRFEQRIVEDDFELRFRYFLSVNLPLNNSTMQDKTLYLTSYNEIFINTENTLFDRNRLYGGLGFKVNKNLRLEAGYMNQFFSTRSRDQINLIAFVNI